ncbi:hypothetical protein EDEG_04010, partial [Edhazardia aedis USNM 41457]
MRNLNCSLKRKHLKRNHVLESLVNTYNKTPSTILTLNCNGLDTKVEEVNILLDRFRPDVVCLQETRRHSPAKHLFINGYNVVEHHAGPGLGLLMGIRKSVSIAWHVHHSDENVMGVSMKCRNIGVVVCNVYRPHGPAAKHAISSMCRAFNSAKNRPTLATGDWNTKPKTLENVLRRKGVEAYVPKPSSRGTRVVRGRRTTRPIDYTVTNLESVIKHQSVKSNWRISDHLPVITSLNIDKFPETKMVRTVFDVRRLKSATVKNQILKHRFVSDTDECPNLEKFTSEYIELLRKLKVILEEPLICGKVPNVQIKRAVKRKRRMIYKQRHGLATEHDVDRSQMALHRTIKSQRKRELHEYYNRGIKALATSDMRQAWRWLKQHSGLAATKKTVNAVFVPGTKRPAESLEERMSIWENHFACLCAKPEPGVYKLKATSPTGQYASETDKEISYPELKEALRKCKNNKASTLDTLPTECWKVVLDVKDGMSSLGKCILRGLNGVIKGGRSPVVWDDCVIVPIYKKGDKLDPYNYRGIVLICTLA